MVQSSVRDSGFGVPGSGSGFRVPGSGFRVRGSGFGVPGSRVPVPGSGSASPDPTERLNYRSKHAPVQTPHRVCRHPLQRLANPEECAHGAGRDRPRGAGGAPSGGNSSCTGPGERMPASMRSRRSRTSKLYTDLPPESLRRKINDELPGRHPHPRNRESAAPVPCAARRASRAATCTRSHGGERRSASPMSGGSENHSTSARCGQRPPRSSG